MKRTITFSLFAISLTASVASYSADNIEGLARTCDICHGTGGVSAGLSMPSIAGQSEAYLNHVMAEWKSGARSSTIMGRLVGGLTDEEITGLASHYAKLPWVAQVQKTTEEVLKDSEFIMHGCLTCHGDTGGTPDNEYVPLLNGQWGKYMELELMKYRDEGFLMTHKKMIRNASRMEPDEVPTVAKFLGAQDKQESKQSASK